MNDLAGYRTLYASEWSGNAFVDFRMPMGAMELFGGVDVNYRSEFDSAGSHTLYTDEGAVFGIRGTSRF